MTISPRILLGSSSFILALAGAAHAMAFRRARSAVTSSNLVPFFAGSFKSLWLIDSATCFILAGLLAFIAVNLSAAMQPVVIALALRPAANAFLIYRFLGSFYAGHILLAAAVSAVVAGLTITAGG